MNHQPNCLICFHFSLLLWQTLCLRLLGQTKHQWLQLCSRELWCEYKIPTLLSLLKRTRVCTSFSEKPFCGPVFPISEHLGALQWEKPHLPTRLISKPLPRNPSQLLLFTTAAPGSIQVCLANYFMAGKPLSSPSSKMVFWNSPAGSCYLDFHTSYGTSGKSHTKGSESRSHRCGQQHGPQQLDRKELTLFPEDAPQTRPASAGPSFILHTKPRIGLSLIMSAHIYMELDFSPLLFFIEI